SAPARSSNELSPMRPVFQLSSMNRRMEVWSVTVWSTKFALAYGEITSSGRRGPYPHRPWYAIAGAVGAGHAPGRVSGSSDVAEAETTGDDLWSYQPSESS